LENQKAAPSGAEPRHHWFTTSAGLIVAAISIIFMASALVPNLLATATILGIAIITVVILDLAFQLGVLYSLSFVAVGVFAVLLFFKRKKKARAVSADQIPPRMAA